MTLEEWLEGVHVLALKKFAANMPGVHDARRQQVVAWILSDEESKQMAVESKRIEEGARESALRTR